MSNKLLKSVQFEANAVEIDERKLVGRHEPAKGYLVGELSPLNAGDFKIFDLTDDHKLTVQVRDRGLYSGYITKSDGDIVHYIQAGVVDSLLNNLEAKHLRLAKAPIADNSAVNIPVGGNVTVNINIQKAIDELCNLTKAEKSLDGSGSLDKGDEKKAKDKDDDMKVKDMDKCDYSMKKNKKVDKAAPEGVSEAKYKRCKEHVEEQGGAKNPYAICAASLQRAMKNEEGKKRLGKVFDLLEVTNFMDKGKVHKAYNVLRTMLKTRTDMPDFMAKAILDTGIPTNYLFNMVPCKYDMAEVPKETEIVEFEETLKKSDVDCSDKQEQEMQAKAAELTDAEKEIKIHIDSLFKRD